MISISKVWVVVVVCAEKYFAVQYLDNKENFFPVILIILEELTKIIIIDAKSLWVQKTTKQSLKLIKIFPTFS